jgi:S1-C subfamily serine protease
MDGVMTELVTSMRRVALAAVAATIVLAPAASSSAQARGPESISDVAEKVIDAVVNISTSQNVEGRGNAIPQLPPGSPFEEFFDEFFKNRRGGPAAPVVRAATTTIRTTITPRGASIRSAPASSSIPAGTW